jgi:hypothetical protein
MKPDLRLVMEGHEPAFLRARHPWLRPDHTAILEHPYRLESLLDDDLR